MAVYKDKKRGTWYVSLYYTDWTGKQQRKLKRGFSTKKEAQDWERHFSLEKASSLDMTFALEMKDFLDSIYGIEPSDRIFVISKSYLHHEMDRGVKASGVKRIRLHDLRHSHVSLLIDMGFSAVAIGNRVGHESSDITYRYAHMMPSIQDDMAEALDEEWKEGFDVSEES